MEGVGAVVSPVGRSKIVRVGKTALSSLQQDIPLNNNEVDTFLKPNNRSICYPGRKVTLDLH